MRPAKIKRVVATGCSCKQIGKEEKTNGTNMVTASLTTPAIVTVTALVTETRTYSVNTCKKEIHL